MTGAAEAWTRREELPHATWCSRREYACPGCGDEPLGVAMPKDILDQIPDWLNTLHDMENELQRAARHGLIFRWKEACEHFSEARGHLEQSMRDAKGEEPPDGPRTPLRKEGEC